MITLYQRILLIMILAFVAQGAWAQLRPEAGAPSQSASSTFTHGKVDIQQFELACIVTVQDHRGFMWFGCIDGLYRYDGYGFTHYQHNPDDSTSLGHDTVSMLYVDLDGVLWVGTGSLEDGFGGLDRYDLRTNSFSSITGITGKTPERCPLGLVSSMLQDSKGAFWVGTLGGGLNRFDPDTETFFHYRHDPDVTTSLIDNYVWVIYEDREGTLWVGNSDGKGTRGGLNKFDTSTATFTRFQHNPDDPGSLVSNPVFTLHEDSRGTFWVGTLGDGLHTMDREAGTFIHHRYDRLHPSTTSRPYLEEVLPFDENCMGGPLVCGAVTFIHEDQTGILWIGSFGQSGGISQYDLKTGLMSHHRPGNSGLIDGWISRISESHDGTLWVSTSLNNMHRIVNSSLNQFISYSFDPDRKGMGGKYVGPLLEDRNQGLWIGYGLNEGLDRYDPFTDSFTNYKPENTNSFGRWVASLYEDPAGLIWVGFFDGEFSSLDPASGEFTHFQTPEGGFIKTLFEDSQGRFWVGNDGGGLYLFDKSAGTFINYAHVDGDPQSLSNNRVMDVVEGHDGLLWIGTWGGGLNRFDPATGFFTRYLEDEIIPRLLEDQSGRLWLGTWDNGFYLFDRETGQSRHYDVEDGLPGGKVKGLVDDDDGYLWISMVEGTWEESKKGRLSRFDVSTESFTTFDAKDGLPNISFSNKGALKSERGALYFGGARGFTTFDPGAISTKSYKLQHVSFTSLRVRNADVVPGPGSPIEKPIQLVEEIRLTHDQNDFSIDYVSPSFRNPEGFKYFHRLEGYDTEWVHARRQRSARYASLAPGTYTFHARAIDERGQRIERDASLRVVVLPPWWMTTFAYVIYGLLFAIGTLGIDRFMRKRVIGKERERTRERELAQAKEIEKAYTQLKATQQQLVQQEKMASLGQLTAGIAHEIKNPLNFVYNFATLNTELAKEISEQYRSNPNLRVSDIQDDLAHIKLNAAQVAKHGKRADRIVESMMQHASGGVSIRKKVDLNAQVEEYLNLASHSWGSRGTIEDAGDTDLVGDSSGRIRITGSRRDLKQRVPRLIRKFDTDMGEVELVPREIGQVLINLLNNAFDALQDCEGEESQIVVETIRGEGKVEIRVGDNGDGIPKQVRDKIFEPFFTTKAAGSGTGLGLSLSYDIVTRGHGGQMRVESEEGKGATFVITLPCYPGSAKE